MRNFIRTKFFAVLVSVAIVFTIVPSVLYAMGVGNVARDLVNTVLSPFTKGFTRITDALDGFNSYFTEFDRVVEENKQLKEHISELEDKVYKAEAIEGMMPHNKLTAASVKKLHVFAGSEHPYAAQKPETYEIKKVAQ